MVKFGSNFSYRIVSEFRIKGKVSESDIHGALYINSTSYDENYSFQKLQKFKRMGKLQVTFQKSEDPDESYGFFKVDIQGDRYDISIISACIQLVKRVKLFVSFFKVKEIIFLNHQKIEELKQRAIILLKKFLPVAPVAHMKRDLVKAMASEIFLKEDNNLILGTDYTNKTLILVEGRADVINLHRNRIHNVIGLGGYDYDQTILNSYIKDKKIICFLDGDEGGSEISKKVTKGHSSCKFTHIKCKKGEKVEDLSPARLEELLVEFFPKKSS